MQVGAPLRPLSSPILSRTHATAQTGSGFLMLESGFIIHC